MQTYYAKSLFVSKTFWTNLALLLVAVVKETPYGNMLPPVITENLLAIAAAINIVLRIWTVRPVTVSAPDTITAVNVKSL